MDPQIEELKELVRQNIALTQDTNRMVHKIRRSEITKSIVWFVIILVSVVAPTIALYYYAAPYVGQIQSMYDQIQSTAAEARDLINKFSPGQSSTTPQGR
jgi:predicted PurR-regulated permease PerM